MAEPISAEVVLTVPFFDVDMMRVAWHGHYLKYFESARCALLDMLDYNYAAMEASGYAWPVVDCRVKYIKSARFNRAIRVRATLTEFENRLRMEFLITDEESGERLTTGYTIQVAVDMQNGELCYVTPPILEQKIQQLMASR